MTKWQWMMDYCEKNRMPPAQKWAWDKAEEAYDHLGPEFEDGPECEGWDERSKCVQDFAD